MHFRQFNVAASFLQILFESYADILDVRFSEGIRGWKGPDIGGILLSEASIRIPPPCNRGTRDGETRGTPRHLQLQGTDTGTPGEG